MPKPQPGQVIRILVADDATIPPAYQMVAIGQGSKVEWYLAETPGVTKKLDIDIPSQTPPRFVKTNVSDMETRVVRTGVGKYECEAHAYKIMVWINGVAVPGDPMLIIRE